MSDPRERRQALDESVRVAVQSGTHEGGHWAVLISAVALIISVFSLYETMLKQARPVLHIGGIIQYAQDTLQPADVFIVPLTITNSGARDVIILELNLRVAKAGSGDPIWTEMTGLYHGTNPRSAKALFTPISVPGRSARTANVLFYRDGEAGGAPEAIVNGNEAFRFCLTGRVDGSDDFGLFGEPDAPAIQFEAEARAYGREDLIAGRTVALRVRNMQAAGGQQATQEAASGC